MEEKRQLKMMVAGSLVKHLGLQMYSGAVPSLAELISNAYDAMAQEVNLSIPFDRPVTDGDEIVVEDDGHGMRWDDCEYRYLVIGRDRRKDDGDFSEEYGFTKTSGDVA